MHSSKSSHSTCAGSYICVIQEIECLSTINIHNNSWQYAPTNLTEALYGISSIIHNHNISVDDYAHSDKVHIINTLKNKITPLQ